MTTLSPRRGSRRPPERGLSKVALAALAMATVVSCSGVGREGDPRIDADALAGAAADPELDCVTHGYPCTWSEVDPAALELTQELADQATTRLDAGDAITAVAAWLESQPEMGSVLHDSLLIRFRLNRGRPVWVGTPEAAELGIRGGGQTTSPPQGPRKADPVGEQTPGVRPEKAFLFVDPYRYEFYLDVDAGTIPVEDDASRRLPKLFGKVRDYKCTPGRRCACPESQCYRYVGNDWAAWCDPHAPTCHVDANVTLADFKSWRSYDAIHVASHGSQLCNAQGTVCGGGIASGRFVRDDLKELAEAYRATNRGLPPASADWLTETGIELYRLGFPPGACKRFTSGTPGYSFAQCDAQQRVWREYLGTDFFKANYKPGDLKDKLIFLSSCFSAHPNGTLAKYLAGPADENAVVGWSGVVWNSGASRAATVFYEEWLAGKTAYEAFQTVQSDSRNKGLQFLGGRSILRGGGQVDSPSPVGAPKTEGLSRKRGVETVHLFDPATGTEISDGGTLPLKSRPGDGSPDTLDTWLEVVGVDAQEDPAAYALRVRVGERDVPGTVRFNLDVGLGTHRYRGPMDLGIDLVPDRPIDVEVSADLPDGGETRWLYYDLVPRVGPLCEFSASVSSGPYAGVYAGPATKLGNALVLRDRDTDWEARIEVPSVENGEYSTSLQVVAARAETPDMPRPVYFWASTDAPASRGTVRVTGAEGQLRQPGRDGVLRGAVTGHLGWREHARGYSYVDVQIEFRAVTFAVSPRSPYQQCLSSWKSR